MIAGCATMQDRGRQDQFEITEMIFCLEEPGGFGKYEEVKDNTVTSDSTFWIYFEYKGLIENNGLVNLSGSMNINNIKGVSVSGGQLFNKQTKPGEHFSKREQYLIGVIDQTGWIAFAMWSGYYNAEYEMIITLKDDYSGKQATESIWFKVNNTIKV